MEKLLREAYDILQQGEDYGQHSWEIDGENVATRIFAWFKEVEAMLGLPRSKRGEEDEYDIIDG